MLFSFNYRIVCFFTFSLILGQFSTIGLFAKKRKFEQQFSIDLTKLQSYTDRNVNYLLSVIKKYPDKLSKESLKEIKRFLFTPEVFLFNKFKNRINIPFKIEYEGSAEIINTFSDEDICVICQEKLSENREIIIKTDCDHFFCYGCIAKFIMDKLVDEEMTSIGCPLCRKKLYNFSKNQMPVFYIREIPEETIIFQNEKILKELVLRNIYRTSSFLLNIINGILKQNELLTLNDLFEQKSLFKFMIEVENDYFKFLLENNFVNLSFSEKTILFMIMQDAKIGKYDTNVFPITKYKEQYFNLVYRSLEQILEKGILKKDEMYALVAENIIFDDQMNMEDRVNLVLQLIDSFGIKYDSLPRPLSYQYSNYHPKKIPILNCKNGDIYTLDVHIFLEKLQFLVEKKFGNISRKIPWQELSVFVELIQLISGKKDVNDWLIFVLNNLDNFTETNLFHNSSIIREILMDVIDYDSIGIKDETKIVAQETLFAMFKNLLLREEKFRSGKILDLIIKCFSCIKDEIGDKKKVEIVNLITSSREFNETTNVDNVVWHICLLEFIFNLYKTEASQTTKYSAIKSIIIEKLPAIKFKISMILSLLKTSNRHLAGQIIGFCLLVEDSGMSTFGGFGNFFRTTLIDLLKNIKYDNSDFIDRNIFLYVIGQMLIPRFELLREIEQKDTINLFKSFIENIFSGKPYFCEMPQYGIYHFSQILTPVINIINKFDKIKRDEDKINLLELIIYIAKFCDMGSFDSDVSKKINELLRSCQDIKQIESNNIIKSALQALIISLQNSARQLD